MMKSSMSRVIVGLAVLLCAPTASILHAAQQSDSIDPEIAIEHSGELDRVRSILPVSYTHLTLPTN